MFLGSTTSALLLAIVVLVIFALPLLFIILYLAATHKKYQNVIRAEINKFADKINRNETTNVPDLWEKLIVALGAIGYEPKTLYIAGDHYLTGVWDKDLFLGENIAELLDKYELPTKIVIYDPWKMDYEEMFKRTNSSVLIPFEFPSLNYGPSAGLKEITGFILIRKLGKQKLYRSLDRDLFGFISTTIDSRLGIIRLKNVCKAQFEEKVKDLTSWKQLNCQINPL